jgi:hypothetical protein
MAAAFLNKLQKVARQRRGVLVVMHAVRAEAFIFQ